MRLELLKTHHCAVSKNTSLDEILSKRRFVQCSMSDSCPSTSVRRQLEFGTKRQIVDIPTLFSTKSDGWDLAQSYLVYPKYYRLITKICDRAKYDNRL